MTTYRYSTASASQHGFVDFRHMAGAAVVAHLDGHVRTLDEDKLRDKEGV